MYDEFAAERLPDIPHDGYATRRERAASDAIMFFMREAERHREVLLYIVCQGRDTWRSMARRQWRGLGIEDDTLNAIFRYFVWQAGPDPADQLAILTSLRAH